jgi:dienelactone hydrolase
MWHKTTITLIYLVLALYGGGCLADTKLPKYYLELPKAKPPFPLVVIAHGCAGLSKNGQRNWQEWAKWFQEHHFATVIVDSWANRDVGNVCEMPGRLANLLLPMRVEDAYAVVADISKQHPINPEQIFLIGGSHGGRLAYEILTPNHARQMGEKYSVKFAGAVGLYPGCSPQMINEPTKSPLLLIVGEVDDWTLPKYCYDLVRSAKFSSTPGFDIEVKSIQGAGHSFDYYWEQITMRGVTGQGGKVGVTVGGRQAQRAEAENLTWEFISRVINKKVPPRVPYVAAPQPSESSLQLQDIREPTEEDVRGYEKKIKPKK